MHELSAAPDARTPQLPIALKVFMVLFSCALAAYNSITHGAWSLLYFCDVALFLATIGICLERSLPISMAAVGVVLIQLLWTVDLVTTILGFPLVGLTGYMLIDTVPVWKRSLSLFHLWLPVVLLYCLARLGYDSRAFWRWTAVTCVVLLISYFLLPPPPAPADNPNLAVNVNYVFGLNMRAPQKQIPWWAWLGALLFCLPAFLFYPTHRAFMRVFKPAPLASPARAGASDLSAA